MNQLEALHETVRLAEERGMPELPGSDVGLAHLRSMAHTAEAASFSDAKLGRWLGWAQCAVVAANVGVTLADMKALNTKWSADRVPTAAVTALHEGPSASVRAATLFAPRVRFVSSGESQFDAMMTWRAELEMAYLDDGDTPDVVVGYAEFLTIRLGEHPIADLLDSISQDAEHFAVLFDDDDVNEAVQEQFSDAMPFNRIVLITMVLVAEPLRGHDLGAWLVSEVIARMGGAIDTLVLLYPYPAVNPTGDASELAAVNCLAGYWRRTGLEHIQAYPEFLGQSTAYRSLPEARRELSGVAEAQISVPGNQLSDEPTCWAERRHVLGDEVTTVR